MRALRITVAIGATLALLIGPVSAAPGGTPSAGQVSPDQAAGPCVRPPTGLTGWWPGDGDHDDIVGGRDAVLHGDASFGPGVVDKAFVLDGDGDFVDVADDSALDVGTGDFTVDLWVMFNDTAGEQILIEKYVERFDPAESTGWTLTKLEGNEILLALGAGGGGAGSAPLNIPPNMWVYVAARRSGSEFSVFLNGGQIASGSVAESASGDLDTTASLKFGHRGSPDDTPGSLDGSGFFLNGQIDEVELTVGRALSDEEIVEIYLAGAAGKCKDVSEPTSCADAPDGLTGWWPGDRSADDIVGGRDAILHGDAKFGPGLVSGAFVMDGDGDFASVPDDSGLDFGTGDFTVDLWVKFRDTGGEQVLVEKWVQGSENPSTGWTLTKLEDNSIRVALASSVGEIDIDSAPLALPQDKWLFFSARRSGSAFSIFMNGVQIASGTVDESISVDLDTTASLKFGHRGSPQDTPGSEDDRGFFLNGQIDEVELTVGSAISDAEIVNIYLAGAAGKCRDLD